MTGVPLRLYDSYTRSLRPFEPIAPGRASVYSCGPTVYNYAHVGNLRAYVFTDTLGRVLTAKGYDLTHIINITDVGHLTSDADAGDDKMEAAARRSGQDIWAVARHYTDAFKRNLADLNIRTPSRFPLATDHVGEMIRFAEAIEAAHCYRLESGLYFDISTVADYGRLARVADDEREGRIDPVAGKRHPQDFAIWRTSTPGENRQMEWDSPWGRGAPGWHLECSVMSRKYLGETFDIHTGGIDHREIHHPNEIAQNQAHHAACCGSLPAGYTGAVTWMHNNFLVERAGKMSKSSGEFLTLQALVDHGYHPLAYRMLCLQAHYRSELEFSWENLAAAQVRLKRLVQGIEGLRARADGTGTPSDRYAADLDAAMSDDLNTAKALPVLDALVADKALSPADRLATLAGFDAVLGLRLTEISRAELRTRPAAATIDDQGIERALDNRRAARVAKDFARSDAIRDTLAAQGVEVMDGDPLGWDWKPVAG